MSILEALAMSYAIIALIVFVYEVAWLIAKTESFENNGVPLMLFVVAVISIAWPISLVYVLVTYRNKGLQ